VVNRMPRIAKKNKLPESSILPRKPCIPISSRIIGVVKVVNLLPNQVVTAITVEVEHQDVGSQRKVLRITRGQLGRKISVLLREVFHAGVVCIFELRGWD